MIQFSRIGFILSLAGSAIGLGNIWKFPYVAGANGGGAFIFIFIIAVLFVLFSVFMAEIILGRESTKDPVSTFETLAIKNKHIWKYSGFMIISGLLILSFYSMVLGWILYYMIYLLFSIPSHGDEASALFAHFVQHEVFYQIIAHFVIIALCGFVLVKGIKKGIEALNVILMPSLFLIFIFLFFYALTLESFSESFAFMFNFRWEQITSHVILEAMGQAFFSMSVGVGTVMVYSAAIPKHTNFISSSIYIALLNTGLAIIAGLIIFSLLFEYNLQPNAGPGLIFISLPTIFAQLGAFGHVMAFVFFIALIFAGITSAVSMAEPSIAYLIQRQNQQRKKATFVVMLFCFLLGVIVIIGGSVYWDSAKYLGGNSVFDWLDKLTSTVFMPLAGIIMCLFVGFITPKDKTYKMFDNYISYKTFTFWLILIRFVAPVAIGTIMLQSFFAQFFNIDIISAIAMKL